MMWWKSLTDFGQKVVGFGTLIVVLIFVVLTLAWCDARKDAREVRGEAKMSEGRTISAVEAITAINDLGERSDATDAEVESAEDAIRQADPEDRDRVFRYRVCLLQHRTDCDGLQ